MAREKLGWVPKIGFSELVKEMIQSDLLESKKNSMLKDHGFDVMVSRGE